MATQPQNSIVDALKAATSRGKVTRAKFELVQEGNNGTDTGDVWGVVHLYRDEEVSPESLAAKESPVPAKGLPADDSMLCIPAVPAYLTPSDFLMWIGEKTRAEVSHIRMVVTGKDNMYLVLMQFRDGEYARKWRGVCNGRLFNNVEVRLLSSLHTALSLKLVSGTDREQPETCDIAFIKSITVRTGTGGQKSISFPELSYYPFSPSTQTEIHTCPVCLERMDDTAEVVTILCQHVFHTSCLHKWRGGSCPVCRSTNPTLNSSPFIYDPNSVPFGSGEAPTCGVCGSVEDLWICLLCGNVGCGRYKGAHQKEHWKETAHNLAVEIETQHVWDYAVCFSFFFCFLLLICFSAMEEERLMVAGR